MPVGSASLDLGPDTNDNKGWNVNGSAPLSTMGPYYFAITLDPTTIEQQNGYDAIKQTLYVNGEPLVDGWYYLDQWKNLNTGKEKLKCFTIGMSTQNSPTGWFISKINCKSLRLYSSTLDKEEIRQEL